MVRISPAKWGVNSHARVACPGRLCGKVTAFHQLLQSPTGYDSSWRPSAPAHRRRPTLAAAYKQIVSDLPGQIGTLVFAAGAPYISVRPAHRMTPEGGFYGSSDWRHRPGF